MSIVKNRNENRTVSHPLVSVMNFKFLFNLFHLKKVISFHFLAFVGLIPHLCLKFLYERARDVYIYSSLIYSLDLQWL